MSWKSFLGSQMKNFIICSIVMPLAFCYATVRETMSEAARPPSEGNKNPSGREKGGMPMYITLSDLTQIGLFIVALVVACYTIFKSKKN